MPEVLPFEMTRPSGLPSGVKKPALMARRAFWEVATAADEG